MHFEDGQADIRISFEPGKGNFSYVGMQSGSIPVHLPTMNLELADGTMEEVFSVLILHEFGHAIGDYCQVVLCEGDRAKN